jgi:hypothetical protein
MTSFDAQLYHQLWSVIRLRKRDRIGTENPIIIICDYVQSHDEHKYILL